MSWDKLPANIDSALSSMIDTLIDGLTKDTGKFAALVGILAGEEALEIGFSMLCRGIVNSVGAGAITAAATDFVTTGTGAAAFTAAIKFIKDHEKPDPGPDKPPKPPVNLSVRYQTDTAPYAIAFSWSMMPGGRGLPRRQTQKLYATDPICA